MAILIICLVIFIVFMAAGYAGLFVQRRLQPRRDEHTRVHSNIVDRSPPSIDAWLSDFRDDISPSSCRPQSIA